MIELGFPRAYSYMGCLQTWYKAKISLLDSFWTHLQPVTPKTLSLVAKEKPHTVAFMKSGLPSPLFSSIRIFFYPVFLQRANVSQLSHWGKNVIYLPRGSRNLPGYRWGRSDAHGIGAPSCPVSQVAEFGDRRLGGWEAGRLRSFLLPYSTQRTRPSGWLCWCPRALSHIPFASVLPMQGACISFMNFVANHLWYFSLLECPTNPNACRSETSKT